VDVVKRLAVSSSTARQLGDPAGAHPALPDGICDISGTERAPDLEAMAGIAIADHHWNVPVSAELGDNLLMRLCFFLTIRSKSAASSVAS
jgi:hypothetical protein